MDRYVEIESYDALQPLLYPGAVLEHYAFQNIEFGRNAVQCSFRDCIFFGCTMPDVMRNELAPDCCVLPELPKPFNPFPVTTTETLLHLGNVMIHASTTIISPMASRLLILRRLLPVRCTTIR